MSFAHPAVLYALLALPLVVFLQVVGARRRRRALESFADPDLLPRIAPLESGPRVFVRSACVTGALGLIVVALAGPLWGERYQEVSQKGADIMLCLDVSQSMLVSDVSPNRLEREKREVADLASVAAGDRLGLVAFAGDAFVLCPLTLDYQALDLFLQQLAPDLIPSPGTDLGKAIRAAMAGFDADAPTDKVILLMTDGEDNEGQGRKAAQEAAAHGVKIFVYGIGNPTGGPVPASADGGFAKDAGGGMVLSKLDESALADIAGATGGVYARSSEGDSDLDRVYFEGIRQRTEAKQTKTAKISIREERFFLFLAGAWVLLFLEAFLLWRPMFSKKTAAVAAAVLFVLMAGRAWAGQDGESLFRQGKYKEAAEAFAKADMEDPKEIRWRYNRGVAAVMAKDPQAGEAAFSSVLKRSKDRDILFRSAYNLGSLAFEGKDFDGAVSWFKKALMEKPGDEDARANLQLALWWQQKAKKDKEKSSCPNDQQNKQEDKGQEKKQDNNKQGQDKQGENKQQGQQKKEESSQQQGQDQKPQEAQGQERQPDPANLDGDLKAMEDAAASPEEPGKGNPKDATAQMAKNKAEALLDNAQDGMKVLFQGAGQEAGPGSGKNW